MPPLCSLVFTLVWLLSNFKFHGSGLKRHNLLGCSRLADPCSETAIKKQPQRGGVGIDVFWEIIIIKRK